MSTSPIQTEAVRVPDAPAIPGLRFRRFQGESDYAHVAAVIEACKGADEIEETLTVEDVARNFAHLKNCDPYQDVLFLEVHGDVIGYNRAWWEKVADGPWLYRWFGRLKPEWRGRGLGRAVLQHLEGHLRAMAAGHPQDGERFFETSAYDSERAREALLLSAGYQPARYEYYMVRPLDEPIPEVPLPAGLEVRPVQPEQYRTVWEADVEAFRDHWGYVPPVESDFQHFLDSPTFKPELWRVAFDAASGEVAGMVLNFFDERENAEYRRQRGYTEGISVRRPWRRRGLARALLARSLQMFKDMGMTEAALSVDADNPNGARRLYESVGFRLVKSETTYWKPLE